MRITKALLLLSAFALVACGSNNSSSVSESSKEASITTSETSASTSEETTTSVATSESTTTSTSSASSTSTASSQSSTIEPDPVGVTKKTVTFYNGGFTNSSLDREASRNEFVEWFNGTDDVLTSIGYEGYAQLNYIGNASDSWRFSTLILGSSSKTGKITFNFKYDIVSVKVEVQAYSKYIAYNNTYSTDTGATFVLDNDEHDLSLADGYQGDTERKTFEKAYNEGTKTISIANKDEGERVFVHSLELTYWG